MKADYYKIKPQINENFLKYLEKINNDPWAIKGYHSDRETVSESSDISDNDDINDFG